MRTDSSTFAGTNSYPGVPWAFLVRRATVSRTCRVSRFVSPLHAAELLSPGSRINSTRSRRTRARGDDRDVTDIYEIVAQRRAAVRHRKTWGNQFGWLVRMTGLVRAEPNHRERQNQPRQGDHRREKKKGTERNEGFVQAEGTDLPSARRAATPF